MEATNVARVGGVLFRCKKSVANSFSRCIRFGVDKDCCIKSMESSQRGQHISAIYDISKKVVGSARIYGLRYQHGAKSIKKNYGQSDSHVSLQNLQVCLLFRLN